MRNVKMQGSVGRRAARMSAVLAIAIAWSWTFLGPAAATGTPDVTITKDSHASGPLHVGDELSYTLTVGNAGSATAHGIEVQDDLPFGVHVTTLVPDFPGGQCTVASSAGTGHAEHWSVTCTRPSLAAGASVPVTFGVKLTSDVHCGDVTNTAAVAASDEPSAAQGNDEASVTDTVTCPPSIKMTKSAPGYTHVGSTVPFTMLVSNTGYVALTHVTVSDPGCDAPPTLRRHGNGDATLSPGETWTYGCAHHVQRDGPDWVATTATVRARSSAGAAHATARQATRVLSPKLSISVTPTPINGTPGDSVRYRYVLRNTGNATLTSLTITDDRLGRVGAVAKLVPGHSATFTVDRILTAHNPWVINTATATGEDPSGHSVTTSKHAAVTIVDVAGPGGSDGGDGTAFTGGDATLPAIAALLLAIAGIASLVEAERRRA